MRKKGVLRKCFIIILVLILWGGDLAAPIWKTHAISVKAETETTTFETVGINVAYHTEDEIRAFLQSSGAKPEDPVTYKVKPSVKTPHNAGSLTDKTLNSALNMVNQIRYIAGISYNVKLNEAYVAKAQAASLVNRVNNVLSHFPEKPASMQDAIYQLGAQGAGSSNLAMGYSTINSSLLYGYMNDGDAYNIDRVGHRRWILNPEMSAAGFGYCDNYSAMYVFDSDNISATECGVIWPAQTMPTDYFGQNYPWSISLGYKVNKDSVQVTLKRLGDNKIWKFNNSTADGYFNVNNDGYGQTGCIIFRPDDIESYTNNDQFQVTITGLNIPVSYQVTFFDLIPVTSVKVQEKNVKLIKGNVIYPEYSVTPANASNKEVVLTSSDESVAKIIKYSGVEGKGYGKATITATSLSNGLTASFTITIVPERNSITNITSSKKGQLTVFFEKDKTVSGYEVVYATNEQFTKNKKIKAIGKASTSKLTISGLKSGQVYYVKVRAYVLKNGKKIYGDFSYLDYIWVE
ncbi:MAG: Ig-like domain-containing protein [Mobilitalea sp.]